MITLIAFILILSLLIFIHELGHFVAAKKSGVMVEEFGLGIPPRIWGKRFGETIYSINALPFGGFVKLFGEDVGDSSEEIKIHPKSFLSKSPWQRAIILTAGVLMNFLLTIFLYFLLFSITGYKTLNIPVFFDYQFRFGEVAIINTVVTSFSEDSPAKKAGLLAGEAILEIDGVPVKDIEGIRSAVGDRPNQEVTVSVRDLRNQTENMIRSISFTTTQNEEGKGVLGVYISDSAKIHYRDKLLAPLQHSYNMLAYTGHTFKQFVKIAFEEKSVQPVSSGVAGPVGIYSVVESILSYGGIDALLGLLDFVALLSLSLAILNILPLPALDGGRLLFVAYEVVIGKPMNQKYETAVHKWGMIFFFGLLFLVTIKDIKQFFPF